MHKNDKALAHLSEDPVMKRLIDTLTPREWVVERNLFLDLIGSIIGQQLSVKASDTIEKRFLGLFKNKEPVAEDILGVDDETLRGIGISYSKIKYIKGICQAVIDGNIDFEDLRGKEDEVIIEQLIELKGVGRWTAEMFLMFSLGRPDVFSMGDLGLRNAVSRLYNVHRDDLIAIEKISAIWSPYRTLACLYLWESLDNTPKG